MDERHLQEIGGAVVAGSLVLRNRHLRIAANRWFIYFQETERFLNSLTQEVQIPPTHPKSGIVLTDQKERQGSIIQCSCLQGKPESFDSGFFIGLNWSKPKLSFEPRKASGYLLRQTSIDKKAIHHLERW